MRLQQGKWLCEIKIKAQGNYMNTLMCDAFVVEIYYANQYFKTFNVNRLPPPQLVNQKVNRISSLLYDILCPPPYLPFTIPLKLLNPAKTVHMKYERQKNLQNPQTEKKRKKTYFFPSILSSILKELEYTLVARASKRSDCTRSLSPVKNVLLLTTFIL